MKVSSPEALLVTSDKMLLKGICNQYNISHADSYNIKSNPDVYIIKDRFGCGCNNVKITNNKNLKVPSNRVYEKYVTGESYSVSLYISGSNYEMISINQQVIKLYRNNLKLKAINVNIYPIFRNSLFKFIDDILIAIPGLEGFIGFDFIYNNKELFLIDINPRFTTSMSAINTCKGNHILDYINESIYEQTGIPCKINL
jgi:predicted ATP-grasp superfamily ATP-dependent carboligase